MTRLYARSEKGKRAYGSAPFGGYTQLTVLGALSLTGVVAVMTIEAATCTDVFLAFVEHVLLPALSPGQVVVMDNLRPHKVARVRELIEASGCQLMYLPPYSPDFSPIEPCWGKIKAKLRAMAARTVEALDLALVTALDSVTARDAEGWFTHCGYPSTPT